MKKISILAFIYFLLAPFIYADEFTDCMQIERLKLRREGLSISESISNARKTCLANFNGNNQQNQPQKREKINIVEGIHNFNLDILLGRKNVSCKDWIECKDEDKFSQHNVAGLLTDFFFNPSFSLAIQVLNSKSQSVESAFNQDDVTELSNFFLDTLELSLGLRTHFRDTKRNEGLDFFLGLGIARISAFFFVDEKSSSSCDNAIACSAGNGNGAYLESGIKYLTKPGFNIGLYVRYSSAEILLNQASSNKKVSRLLDTEGNFPESNFGGVASGLTIGWAW